MSAVMEKIGHEQRLQRRFEVLQAARLRTAAGQELACEIRDFCLGGLFLKLDNPQNDAAAVASLQDGEAMEVSFTPPSAISTQTFNLKARLARRGPNGVGVAFIGSPPIEATRTLNKVATSLRTQRMVSKLYQGMDSKQLQETCKNLLVQALQDAANEFSGLIESKLSATAAQSTNFAERNEVMAAYDQIRSHDLAAQQGVQNRVVESFEHIFKPGRKPEAPREKAGLSIVQTDEFEDWLNLTAEINKLEDRFSLELIAIEPRLEKLYGRPIDRSTNPFAPAVI